MGGKDRVSHPLDSKAVPIAHKGHAPVTLPSTPDTSAIPCCNATGDATAVSSGEGKGSTATLALRWEPQVDPDLEPINPGKVSGQFTCW